MGLLSGLGSLAGGFFGGGDDNIPTGLSFIPDIKTPSFRLSAAPGGDVDLSRIGSPQRFTSELANLADLRAGLDPGFGQITETGVTSLRRGTADILGNAREQLSRRRIEGSSFGAGSLALIEQEGEVAVAEFKAKALLEEINATFSIIDEEFKIKTQNFQFELDELDIAVGLTNAVLGVASAQAEIDKANAVLAAQGESEFFSELGGLGGTLLGTAFGGPIGGAIGGQIGSRIGAIL